MTKIQELKKVLQHCNDLSKADEILEFYDRNFFPIDWCWKNNTEVWILGLEKELHIKIGQTDDS